MILSLIGMSNAGKSYWAKRLEVEQGYTRFCCDDLIARELQVRYPHSRLTNVDDLAIWMGMPYEVEYREREAAYLQAEETVLEEILENVESESAVIDTTGSVIYLPDHLLDRLRHISTVVYLSTSDDHLTQMIETFFSNPKPLVWGQVWNLESGESHEASLMRCYPELLRWRRTRYEALADVTVAHERRRDLTYSTEDFLHDVLQH